MFNVVSTIPALGTGYNQPKYPKFNLSHVDENGEYVVEVALAGFRKNDLEVSFRPYEKNNGYKVLSIRANAEKEESTKNTYVVQSIAKRDVDLSFLVGFNDEVTDCQFVDGMLTLKIKKINNIDYGVKTIEVS